MKRLTPSQIDEARALLGCPSRLLVAVFAWEHGTRAFDQKTAMQVVDRSGGHATKARDELLKLTELGLMERSQGPARNSRVSYGVVKEHRGWPLFVAAAEYFGLLGEETGN